MSGKGRSRGRRSKRRICVLKPNGKIDEQVRPVGPERFGIVTVDCAKARSKWMLCDFYGEVLRGPAMALDASD